MKYRVEDQLDIFVFHDSFISLVSFDGDELTVSAERLNVQKHTEVNPSEFDMEIERAVLTFGGFRMISFEPGRSWTRDETGNLSPVGPEILYHGKEAVDRLLEQLRNRVSVFDLFSQEDGSYGIDGCGKEPFFTVLFGFDHMTVEWDAYRKKAWYELHRQYQYDLTLDTPDGEQTVKAIVGCHEEEVYFGGKKQEPPIVDVVMDYGGKILRGDGRDGSWADTFADLGKHLPDGVSLKCCLTCKYAEHCQPGVQPDDLYCTNNVVGGEGEKRSVPYTFLCEAYQPKSGVC